MEVENEITRDHVRRLIAQGRREDGRGEMEYRPIEVRKGCLPNADGSALCRIGKTQVAAGLKFDVAKPYADRPTEGVFSVGAELSPIASHLFEVGPPSPQSIEFARVVDRGIRSAELVDTKKFGIEEDKVLALYIDLHVLDHHGNLIDAGALAAMGALLSAKMPKIEDGKIVRGEFTGPLELNGVVTTCTFASVGGKFLLDPAMGEETGMDSRLTIATTGSGKICAGQKGGWGAITRAEMDRLMDAALDKGKSLQALL